MRTKKKYIFEGRGSGGRKPKKSSKKSIATLISRRGGKGKEVTHEEIDEALERFLKSGGEIDVQPGPLFGDRGVCPGSKMGWRNQDHRIL